MASLAELREQRRKIDEEKKKLDKQIEEAEAEALATARFAVEDKINKMSNKEKQYILNLIDHDRSSCGEIYNSDNGWSWSANKWYCRKCMLEEILNGEHGGRFDFKISVDIFEVTV